MGAGFSVCIAPPEDRFDPRISRIPRWSRATAGTQGRCAFDLVVHRRQRLKLGSVVNTSAPMSRFIARACTSRSQKWPHLPSSLLVFCARKPSSACTSPGSSMRPLALALHVQELPLPCQLLEAASLGRMVVVFCSMVPNAGSTAGPACSARLCGFEATESVTTTSGGAIRL